MPLSVYARPTDRRSGSGIRDKGQQHLAGDEAWLIGEHRTSGEQKYYLANLPAGTDLRTLAGSVSALIKARLEHGAGHEGSGNISGSLVVRIYASRIQTSLKEAGCVLGKNGAIECRWAEGQYDRLPAMVAGRVAVIFAAGGSDQPG